MKQIILKFGLLATALLILLQLSKYTYITRGFSEEWVVVIFAAVFLAFGFWLGTYLLRSKKSSPEEEALPFQSDEARIAALGISKREYEVLQLIAAGHSNQEIARNLFISESTVKTHVSNLLSKLGAKRRTQAVTIAKGMKIIG